jgi:hypothetical protein
VQFCLKVTDHGSQIFEKANNHLENCQFFHENHRFLTGFETTGNGCSLILSEPASTSTPCRMDGMLTENTFSFVVLSHHQPQWLTLY